MLREIIHSPRFDAELLAIEPDPRRADEIVLDGPGWVISRKPRAGSKVGATDVWCIISVDVPTGREFSLFYRFNDESVELLSVIVGEL